MNISIQFQLVLLALLLPLCGSGLQLEVHAQAVDKSVQAAPIVRTPQLIVQFGHTANINAVAVSRYGRYILSGGDDKTAILWDAEKVSEVRRFVVDAGVITAVAFSPDTKLILIGGGDKSSLTEKASHTENDAYIACLWDIATGDRIRCLKGHTASITGAAFSADGQTIITSSEDKTARLWAVNTGHSIKVLGNDADPINSAVLSPNGRLILTAGGPNNHLRTNASSDNIMRLWDISTGCVIRRFDNQEPISTIAISPDGFFGLSTSDHSPYPLPDNSDSVRLWDLRTGKQIRRLQAAGPACFSPNGRFVLAGPSSYINRKAGALSQSDERATLWRTSTGRFIKRIGDDEEDDRGIIDSLVFRNGNEILIGRNLYSCGGNSGEVCGSVTLDLFNVASDEFLDRLGGRSSFYFTQAYSEGSRQIFDVAFSRSGRVIMLGDSLWDTTTGRPIQLLKPSGEVDYAQDFLAISPNGRFALSTEGDDVRLWSIESGREIRRFSPDDHQGASAAPLQHVVDAWFSPDSQFVLTLSRNVVALWSADTGKSVWRYSGFTLPGRGGIAGGWEYGKGKAYFDVTLSQDGSYVLIAELNAFILLDAKTGIELKRFKGAGTPLPYLEIAPNNKFFITADSTFDLQTGAKRLDIGRAIFSPDGRYLLSATEEVSKEREGYWRSFEEPGASDELDGPDYTVLGRETGEIADKRYRGLWRIKRKLFEVTTGELKREFVTYSTAAKQHDLFYSVDVLAFSNDSRFILTVDPPGNIVSKWDIETGRKTLSFGGHAGDITSVSFSPDDQLILTGSKDGAARLWNSTTGKELCTMVSDGTDWVVVSPEGRFDTNDLEQAYGLNWIMPNDPMTLLPIEIFMRDYYEPLLLPRILKRQKFCEQLSLTALNPVQAKVKRITVVPQLKNPDFVTVRVDVSSEAGSCFKDGQRVRCESGVYDLRLFRDEQLVGQSPNPTGKLTTSDCPGAARQEQFEQWRHRNLVKTDRGRPVKAATGEQTVTFKNIRVPRKSGASHVEFTAYAFNADRVKSATSEPTIYVPPHTRSRVGRFAYVIAVGVDATSDPSLRLGFAPKGAREVQRLLKEKLQSEYEVVTVPLISEYREDSTQLAEDLATKTNVQTVLSILSGRDVTPAQRQSLPNQQQLRAATPDDLVMLYIASHGYADPGGKFYITPSDIGEPSGVSEQLLDRCLKNSEQSAGCDRGREFLNHSISSDELARWIETIDAGQMVLILDSCHSGAVSGPGFKPGPMGDRGFGQLSYDKGMLVLAASQAEQLDWGTLEFGDRSLLTYALTQQQATGQLFDLREWLRNAEKQVPKLYQKFSGSGEYSAMSASEQNQQPSLFDFVKRKNH